MEYNYILGGVAPQTPLVATQPIVSGGVVTINGMPTFNYQNIINAESSQAAIVSVTPVGAVLTLTPNTPAANSDYSFNLGQIISTQFSNEMPAPQGTYINVTTGPVAPTLTVLCNAIRTVITAYGITQPKGVFDVALTGTTTVIITATTANPILTTNTVNGSNTINTAGWLNAGNYYAASFTTAGVAAVGQYSNLVALFGTNPPLEIVQGGLPISGKTYTAFQLYVRGYGLAAPKADVTKDVYNVWVDEGDSNYAAFLLCYNAFILGYMANGLFTVIPSGITTEDTGTHTLFTVGAYTIGDQFVPGMYVQVSAVLNGGTGLPTNYYNGIWQVIGCPDTTHLLLNVPFPTGITYTSGGIIQPLVAIGL
jgi:hypothetical protein